MSLQAAILGIAMLMALIVFAIRRPFPAGFVNGLLLCIGLAAAFIPLRLYSEYWIKFDSFEKLDTFPTFWMVASLIVVAGLVLGVAQLKKPASGAISIAATLAGVGAGAIAQFKPDVLSGVARVIMRLQTAEVIVYDLILLSLLLALARVTLKNAELADPTAASDASTPSTARPST